MRTHCLIAALLLAVSLAVGCARERTVTVPGGNVTVREKGGDAKSVEVKTDKGTATVDTEKKTITEAELGVPVYPGAMVELSSNYAGTAPGEQGNMKQHMLTTPDDFDRVFAFYKSNLKRVKNTINQAAGDGKIGIFAATTESGAEVTVQLSTDKEKKVTRIHVLSVEKSKP